jgi:ADP-ribosyl-[dinitrogen reductase] hydrolase
MAHNNHLVVADCFYFIMDEVGLLTEVVMKGALVGDFVGSRFEFAPLRSRDFDFVHEDCHPTDDSVLTIAVGDAVVNDLDIGENLRKFTWSFPTSYGAHFLDWAYGRFDSYAPYGSWGNGGAMRISTVAHLSKTFAECMELTERATAITHNHPQGIRAAKAVSAAIYAGLSGWKPEQIRLFIEKTFGYDLSSDVDTVKKTSVFDLKSDVSIPKAMICAFTASTVEDAIRNAVYIGGDSDTEAAIAGSIAETWSEVPKDAWRAVWEFLPVSLQNKIEEILTAYALVERTPLSVEEAAAYVGWDVKWVDQWETMEISRAKTTCESLENKGIVEAENVTQPKTSRFQELKATPVKWFRRFRSSAENI